MKIPKIFVPEKNLENSIKQLLEYRRKESEEPCFLKDFVIEPMVKKVWFSFDESLKCLREKGYERHLYPWESFELMSQCLEDEFQDASRLGQILLDSCGEWLNIAVKRVGNKLICYVDPENIKLDDNNLIYVIDKEISPKLEYATEREFDVSGIPSLEWISLKVFNDDFIKIFYNRNLKDLPPQMREGQHRARVYLPPDGILRPVSRGNLSQSSLATRFYLNTYSDYATSRGVCKKRFGK